LNSSSSDWDAGHAKIQRPSANETNGMQTLSMIGFMKAYHSA